MAQTVTHLVRRPSTALPLDTPVGSCPSRARLSSLAVYPCTVHAVSAKLNAPAQATSISLNSETNHSQQTSDPPHARSSAATARVEPRTGHSVLVVEDDPDIAMALHDLVEFEGFHVDCAETCRQAFLSIEQHTYHAILLDLGLPDGDGLSILEKLHVSHPSLPVIVLTASNRDLGSLRAYARLTKPWEREELRGILHRAISTTSPSTAR